jgi:hypothetical protein
VAAEWTTDVVFEPEPDRLIADLGHAGWVRAVERSRTWATR